MGEYLQTFTTTEKKQDAERIAGSIDYLTWLSDELKKEYIFQESFKQPFIKPSISGGQLCRF